MLREMFIAKLHRATVSRTEIDYPGSLTVDTALLEEAGIPLNMKVQVVTQQRNQLEPMLSLWPGEIRSTARPPPQPYDRIIIIAYALN